MQRDAPLAPDDRALPRSNGLKHLMGTWTLKPGDREGSREHCEGKVKLRIYSGLLHRPNPDSATRTTSWPTLCQHGSRTTELMEPQQRAHSQHGGGGGNVGLHSTFIQLLL